MTYTMKTEQSKRGAGSDRSDHTLTGYQWRRDFYVGCATAPSLISLRELDSQEAVAAWRAEQGLPPMGAHDVKALAAEAAALPASAYRKKRVADRPGRHGDAYLRGDHRCLVTSCTSQPKPAFRAARGYAARGSAKQWQAMAEQASAYPPLVAATGIALLAPMNAFLPMDHNPGIWVYGMQAHGRRAVLDWAASAIGNPRSLVKSFSIARKETPALMRSVAGSTLLLDEAVLDAARRAPAGALSIADITRAFSKGAVATTLAMNDVSPFRFAYAIGSDEHPANLFIGSSHAETVTALDRQLVVSVEAMPIPSDLQASITELTQHTFGRVFWRMVEAIQAAHASDPGKLAEGVRRREEAFQTRIDQDTLTGISDRLVAAVARMHATLAFAVHKQLLPASFARPDELLRCLSEHHNSLPSLTPYEQLVSFAQRPDVIDLRNGINQHMTDDDVRHALFIRQVGAHLELCMSASKLATLVRWPAVFLRDPAARRAHRPDGDHETRKVKVRSNKEADRMMCFRMPCITN